MHLAYSFLCCEKLLNLISSQLFIFIFVSITLEVYHRGSCYDLYQSVLPMFSCKSFIVSSLTFRPLIQFDFVFVYSVRKCSNFIILHVTIHDIVQETGIKNIPKRKKCKKAKGLS